MKSNQLFLLMLCLVARTIMTEQIFYNFFSFLIITKIQIFITSVFRGNVKKKLNISLVVNILI